MFTSSDTASYVTQPEQTNIIMLSRALDVEDLYFGYKVLTCIVSEPTFDTLQGILLWLKETPSDPFTLGSGLHGFVDVILSPATYTTLSHMVQHLQ